MSWLSPFIIPWTRAKRTKGVFAISIDSPAELVGATSAAEFLSLLRRVRRRSGLSYRQIEDASRQMSNSGRVAHLSRSGLSDLLNGRQAFDEARLITFLRVCRIRPSEFPDYIVACRRLADQSAEQV